ncbi:MAG: BCD family MFS transporter [Thermoflexales bacterium]|nr:BCD family MFS transporter [Thermoflexales bacterium]
MMTLNKRLLRLSLFQFGLGFSIVVFNGALNRVLIAEEQIPAGFVGWLLSLGLFVAPVRALMGFWSDREQRTYGYRRLPYAWYGMMMVFCALSAAPFSLLLLSKASQLNSEVPFPVAFALCTLIFLLYALGVHIGQTGYLALVTDLTPKRERSQAMAFLWTALIIGQIVSALVISLLLEEFHPIKLIQVMQTSSLVFLVLGVAAIWKQDRPVELEPDSDDFSSKIWGVLSERRMRLFFGILFIGTLGLTAQDVLLEPYGGQVLGMTVSETARLTALWGVGMLAAMGIAWRLIPRLDSPMPIALLSCLVGLVGFGLIASASASRQVLPFALGAAVVGVASGLFLISTLSLVTSLADTKTAGLYVGMWGLVQTFAAGLGALGGSNLRDIVVRITGDIAQSYTAVYLAEIVLISATMLFLLAMPRQAFVLRERPVSAFAGLSDIPGSG